MMSSFSWFSDFGLKLLLRASDDFEKYWVSSDEFSTSNEHVLHVEPARKKKRNPFIYVQSSFDIFEAGKPVKILHCTQENLHISGLGKLKKMMWHDLPLSHNFPYNWP